MAPSYRIRLDVRRLRDESVAQEYKRKLAESLGEPNDSDDPGKLGTDFKTKVLKVSESYNCARYNWNVQELSVAGLDAKGRPDSTGS